MKRIELTKQVLARAMKLAPDNEAYRKLAAELGMQGSHGGHHAPRDAPSMVPYTACAGYFD